LAHWPETGWWIDEALKMTGRDVEPDERATLEAAFEAVEDLPGFDRDEARIDTSVDAHREITMRRFRAVGLDDDLSEALYALDFQPRAWPVYPDVPAVVRGIRQRGCRSALVSDFHVDLRPHLAASGIELDAHVISVEHGFQKPDARMFTTALAALGLEPGEALMVGDRTSHDGGAAAVGIDTLILPPPATFGPRGLDVVLALL
jgi:HAD superfamily hydrolase (TIGR01493 family)